MAQLASCPQCEHELFVPDEADSEAWAKCPECRAFFQLKQAALREVPEVLLVEADPHEAEAKSAPTIAYSSSQATLDNAENDRLEAPELADLEATTLIDQPQASGDLDAAAQRIDEWFRSAKTLPDAAPTAADETGRLNDEAENDLAAADAARTDATIDITAGRLDDIGSSADFELGEAIEPLQSPAAWDDPHHMDQLLADIGASEADEVAAAVGPTIQQGTGNDQPIDASPADIAPEFVSTRQEKRRRKRSPVRTLVMVTVAGVVGSAVGYYALLWIRGPSGDFLEVAQYLPPAMLPASFEANSPQVALNPRPQTIPAEVEPLDEPGFAADAPAEIVDDRAEVQASFTTTDEPAAATPPTIGNRYAVAANDTESPPTVAEPAPLDAPPAAALPDSTETTEPVRIANAPTFTTDDLRTAFELAKTAQPGLITGNFTDSREVAQAKGYSYSMLADLAQKVSFVEGGAQPNEAQPLQQATEELFRQTLADPHARGEVAVILPKWIGSPNRKHGGVFFAAKPASQENKGSVVECRMELDDGQAITVLAPAAIAERPLDSARPLAIVGWIVDRPAEQVTGYTGSAAPAIWASRLIPLE